MRQKVSTWAELIALLIEESGETAYRIAQVAGVSHSVVSSMIAGETPPKAETLRRLLAASGKPWAWIDRSLAAIEPNEEPPPKRTRGRPRKDDEK